MVEALLDTNILILHVSGRERLFFDPNSVAVSTLTVFECLRFPGMPEEEERAFSDLLSLCEIVPVSEAIARRAAQIGRTRPRARPIDILIAATALEIDVPLVTKNTKDFKKMIRLKVRTKL